MFWVQSKMLPSNLGEYNEGVELTRAIRFAQVQLYSGNMKKQNGTIHLLERQCQRRRRQRQPKKPENNKQPIKLKGKTLLHL